MTARSPGTRRRIALLATRPPSGEPGERPRTDIDGLAAATGAYVVPPAPDSSTLRRIEKVLASDIRHALHARAEQPDVYVSFAERLGAPAALLDARGRHIGVAHNFNARRRALQKATHWMNRLERIFVVSSVQQEMLHVHGLGDDAVSFLPDYVDTEFFRPDLADPVAPGGDAGYILAVGQEGRDHETLLQALTISGYAAVIVPSSNWASDRRLDLAVPPNVRVLRGLSWRDLRTLYRHAAAVVVPVKKDTRYAAGVNGLLEGLSMARPVVVSDTPGLRDYLVDEAMYVVKAGDVAHLVGTLRAIHDDPDAERRAHRGRCLVMASNTVERYVERLADAVRTRLHDESGGR